MEKKQFTYHLDYIGDLYFTNRDQATAFFSFLVIWVFLIVMELALGRIVSHRGLATRKDSPRAYWITVAVQAAMIPVAFYLVTRQRTGAP